MPGRSPASGVARSKADGSEAGESTAGGADQLMGHERRVGGKTPNMGGSVGGGGEQRVAYDAGCPVGGVRAGPLTDSEDVVGCGRCACEDTTLLGLPDDDDRVDWLAAVVQGGQRAEELLVDRVGEVLRREIGTHLC